jgi:hypothetical protein
MAWNAPITFVANAVLTAAQLNAQVRDNLSETAPAKATAANRIIVTTGANSVEEREIVDDIVETAQDLAAGTGTTYGDLGTVGPTVTLTTGTKALVLVNCRMTHTVATATCWASFAVSGATTDAAIDGRAVMLSTGSATNPAARMGTATLIAVTAGTNTFTMKYKRSGAATGTATFSARRIQVVAL